MSDFSRRPPESAFLVRFQFKGWIYPVCRVGQRETLFRYRDRTFVVAQREDGSEDLRKGTGCASLGYGRNATQAGLPNFTSTRDSSSPRPSKAQKGKLSPPNCLRRSD